MPRRSGDTSVSPGRRNPPPELTRATSVVKRRTLVTGATNIVPLGCLVNNPAK
jgi:hypothetical protein